MLRLLPTPKANIPDLSGRVFLVTGGNSGVGFEVAKQLTLHGGHVFIAGRNPERCQRAILQIEQDTAAKYSRGKVEFLECNLCSLRSIAQCAKDFKARGLPLHVLFNNAGVENPPDVKSEEGFDPTMATNYAGAFYLTHLLLDKLVSSAPSRLVYTNSLSEAHGTLDTDDLMGTKPGTRSDYVQYARSKLCAFMMHSELHRRLRGTGVDDFSAHPGVCQTDGFRKSDKSKAVAVVMDFGQKLFGQPVRRGAHPLIKCAADPTLQGKGGTELHYGSLYRMLPYSWLGALGGVVTNLFNEAALPPQNHLIYDEQACSRLYTQTLAILNEAAKRSGAPTIEPAGMVTVAAGRWEA